MSAFVSRSLSIAQEIDLTGLRAKARMQARGRLPAGQMNKTEAKYDAHLAQLQHAGEILWRRFEGLKLKLADNTFLTVDFALMRADGVLVMTDVKGSPAIYTDDAKVKMKVAAEMYPFVFMVAFPKRGGGWTEVEV
ncbi:hypothetical protein [Roseomonas chloroacetimidivorans]|uniref:hypothetical protein n=1 Tax=Roseomonas chloroacetimidivorans TaxID=1766656 RepID=UPI003C70C670